MPQFMYYFYTFLNMKFLSIALIMQSRLSNNKCGPFESGALSLSCKRSF